MQMVLRYYLVAWNEGLPKAAPPSWWCDLIFSAERRTASLPLIHLAGGQFGLRRAGQPTDLWVKCLTALGRQPGWASDGGTNDWSNRAVISWHGGWVLQAVLFWGVGGQRGRAAKMGMNVLILRALWEWHTQAIFTGGGTRCWRRQSVCDVEPNMRVRFKGTVQYLAISYFIIFALFLKKETMNSTAG